MVVRLLHGDCRDVLRSLPDASVQCVVTSPPYFGLRQYLPEGHPDMAKQIGLEQSPEAYIAEMVAVFGDVRRVLRDDGTCWINIGDSYATGRTAPRGLGTPPGYKPKDLMMMPARVALALQADGWWLRSEIAWVKPNPMPESCTDRPTASHEKIYLLTKSARYFYDAEAVREETIGTAPGDLDGGPQRNRDGSDANTGRNFRKVKVPGGWDRGEGAHGTIHRTGRTSAEYQEAAIKPGRNMRNVWTIAISPFPEAHFATFPTSLPERCIKAGTSERGACPACGAPWARVMEKGDADLEHQRACGGDASGSYSGTSTKGHAAAGVQDASAVKARILAGMRVNQTVGWRPTCGCSAHEPRPCVVLDPFFGSGTTGLVADRLGRDCIGIDLNADYVTMAERRLRGDAGLFAEVVA